MFRNRTCATGLAAALIVLTSAPALAAPAPAPDPVAACDGGAFTTSTRDGRDVVSCDDGATRDWQRVAIYDAHVTRSASAPLTLRFTVTRRAAGSPLFLAYATADGTALAGADYTAASGSVVLEADETSATVAVPVLPRATAGDDVAFALTLADEQGDVVDFERATATGTIANTVLGTRLDADSACEGGLFDIVIVDGVRAVRCLTGSVVPAYATFRSLPATVDPLAGTATFTLRRENADAPVWLRYVTAGGTARAGVDYTATSGTIVLGPMRERAFVTVPVDPAALTGGDRTFSLRVSNDRTPNNVTAPDLVATIRSAAPLAGTPRLGRPLDGTAATPGASARRWERCDANGACWAIASATGATHEPTADDVGMRLRVRATLPGDAGATIASATPATAPVRGAVTAPSIADGPGQGEQTEVTSATFVLRGKEPDAAYECALDGAPFAPCGTSVALSGLAVGDHALAVRQLTVDALASAVATRTWTVRTPAADPPRTDPPRTDPPRTDPPRTDPPRAEPSPAAHVTGRRQQNRAIAKALAGRANVVLRCSIACRPRAPLTVSRAAAERLGLRSTRVGTATGRGEGGALVRLRVRFDAGAATRLKRIRRPLTLLAHVPSGAGRTVVVRLGLLPPADSAPRG